MNFIVSAQSFIIGKTFVKQIISIKITQVSISNSKRSLCQQVNVFVEVVNILIFSKVTKTHFLINHSSEFFKQRVKIYTIKVKNHIHNIAFCIQSFHSEYCKKSFLLFKNLSINLWFFINFTNFMSHFQQRLRSKHLPFPFSQFQTIWNVKLDHIILGLFSNFCQTNIYQIFWFKIILLICDYFAICIICSKFFLDAFI